MTAAPQIGRVKVAVVGLGWWGKVIVRTLSGSHKLVVVAAVDLDDAARAWAVSEGISASADFEAVVNRHDIDAVILCTPHTKHTQQVVQAANAGKHVFCEKPLALTYADAFASVSACASNNVVLGIGHELRFTPPMEDLRRMIAAGEIGTLVQSEAAFTGIVNHTSANWRVSDTEAPGGPPMTGKGIHALDLCVSLHGPATHVFASLKKSSRQLAHGDTLALLLTFKSGANALITALWSSPFNNRLTVYGTKGWIEIRDKAHPEKADGWTMTICRIDGQAKATEYPPASPVLTNLEAFADAVTGRSRYPIPYDDMLSDIAALEAIGRSASQKVLADVRDINSVRLPVRETRVAP